MARLGSDIAIFPTGGFFHGRALIGLDFCSPYVLGSVWIHLEFITAAVRLIIASKLVSVLSARMAMRLNSLSLQKKFSIRCRHL
jgi:hypothetical protein